MAGMLPRSAFVEATDLNKLNTLSLGDREVWYRYYTLEQEIAEICDGMGLSKGSVQHALLRCRRRAMPKSMHGVRAQFREGRDTSAYNGRGEWRISREEILRRAVAERTSTPASPLPVGGKVYTEEECRLKNLEAQANEEALANRLGFYTWEVVSDGGGVRLHESLDEPPGHGPGNAGAGDSLVCGEEVARAGEGHLR